MASDIEQFASNFSFSMLSKSRDLKSRIFFTLAVLIVCRLGTYVPLPGINPHVISEFVKQNAGGLLGILDMFSGGAIGRMTMFSLGIVPYISASIIVQLMTSVFPSFEALKKEGESGRKKISQYTMYGAIFMAMMQSYGISAGLEHIITQSGPAVMIPGGFFRILTMLTLTGGTAFLVWLGNQITSRGIGNGTSMIIYAGIIANLPQAILKTLEMGRQHILSIAVIFLVFAGIVSVLFYVVFMEKAQRRIPIQYPKRQQTAGMPAIAQNTHLPLKLNNAGVIPPIFASSLLLFPTTIIGFLKIDENSWASVFPRYFGHGKPIYITLFILLIIFFSFFYTALMFNPEETADNLRKGGSYIPGIRPGKQTAEYFDYILTRLTVLGALYLASICIIPELIIASMSLPFYFSGTSILIVVSVTVETLSQIQSHLFAQQYEGLVKKSKNKKGWK